MRKLTITYTHEEINSLGSHAKQQEAAFLVYRKFLKGNKLPLSGKILSFRVAPYEMRHKYFQYRLTSQNGVPVPHNARFVSTCTCISQKKVMRCYKREKAKKLHELHVQVMGEAALQETMPRRNCIQAFMTALASRSMNTNAHDDLPG